jgi:hypothetical protein
MRQSFYYSPYQTKKRRFIFRLKFYFLTSLIFLVIFGLIYFLIISDFWTIKKFEVSGNKKLSTDEVLYNLKPIILSGFFGRFFGSDHFLSWIGNNNIYLKNPLFANVKILKDFIKREIKINIEEKNHYGVWCQQNADQRRQNDLYSATSSQYESALPPSFAKGSCWWFDDEGTIFEAAPYLEGSLIFKILDRSETPLVLGGKIIEERYYKNFKIILNSFSDLDLAAESFVFNRNLEEFTIALINGPKILFSLRFDPQPNIAALKLLKDKEGLDNLEYLDLRVENRLYLKSF